jgi:hypothetical protein
LRIQREPEVEGFDEHFIDVRVAAGSALSFLAFHGSGPLDLSEAGSSTLAWYRAFQEIAANHESVRALLSLDDEGFEFVGGDREGARQLTRELQGNVVHGDTRGL